jgi:hypothetical protein
MINRDNAEQSIRLALRVADEELGIPALIDVGDIMAGNFCGALTLLLTVHFRRCICSDNVFISGTL